jgi:hypothetical protein
MAELDSSLVLGDLKVTGGINLSGDLSITGITSMTGKLSLASLQIGTSTTAGYYLKANDASGNVAWAALPADKYLSGVAGSGDGTVTFTVTNGSNITWDSSHSHSEYITTDKYLSGVSGTCGGNITFTVTNGSNITWDSSHRHQIPVGQSTYYNHSTSAYADAPIYSRPDTEDGWIYCDSVNAQYGIYHRQINTNLVVSGNVDLPGNSIAFIGSNALAAYVALQTGNTYFKGTLTVGGASATVNGQAVVLTNDSRLTDPRLPILHGDSNHNCYAYARISFIPGQSQAIWTHNKGWGDYIIQITPNSPETHFYYTNRSSNSITICLDDPAYESIDVDVVLINPVGITNSGFTMS